MRQASTTLTVTAPAQGLHLITRDVTAWVAAQGMAEGLLSLFIRHTSASLLIQENAAPAARRDLERWLARIAPESSAYEHDDEGPDDMPAHLRSVLTATSLTVPLIDGRLALGTWQGIYLCEHRRHPSPRDIVLHLVGE
ncbi:secondary thiamine-phosphate synthase enzyme YjbQ [Sphingomonas sp. LHG3406-1]|uniref:secondary thiamine-phosphate synthase enzyme YjbQ n=1 Tax=Sphingomonas sp. LHG3406-1 TaxID=2804617 RepID=UPI00260C8843|nr:secondary thiamine-phosphate synthase enzyme YjbQ [Sphingomonas sp. LHG3406-1]